MVQMKSTVFDVQCGVSSMYFTVCNVQVLSMQFSVFIDQCLVISMLYIVHSVYFVVFCVLYGVQCLVFTVQCAVCSVQCAVFCVQCVVQCAVCSVQCVVFSVQYSVVSTAGASLAQLFHRALGAFRIIFIGFPSLTLNNNKTAPTAGQNIKI